MVVPDWFCKILIALGLKDSEEKRLVRKISENEDSRRKLNDELNRWISKIQNLEAEIKVLKPKYESAHGAEKNMIAAKIKPLLQQLDTMKEKEILISQNIKDITSIIHTLEMELHTVSNPDILDKLEDSIDTKQDIIDDMKDQQKASSKLSGLNLQEAKTTELDLDTEGSTVADDNADIDKFFSSMDTDDAQEKTLEEA